MKKIFIFICFLFINRFVTMNFEFLTKKHLNNCMNVSLFKYFDDYDSDFVSTWNTKLDIEERRKNLLNDFFKYCYSYEDVSCNTNFHEMYKGLKNMDEGFLRNILSKISKNSIGVLLLRSLVTIYKKNDIYWFNKVLKRINVSKISFFISENVRSKISIWGSYNWLYGQNISNMVILETGTNTQDRINSKGELLSIGSDDRIIFHELNHIMYNLFSLQKFGNLDGVDEKQDINNEIFDVEKVRYSNNRVFSKFFRDKNVCLQFPVDEIRCIFGLFKDKDKYYMDLINETLYDFFNGNNVIRCKYRGVAMDKNTIFVIPDLFLLFEKKDELKNLLNNESFDNSYSIVRFCGKILKNIAESMQL